MPNDVNLKLNDDSRITTTSNRQFQSRIIINIKLNLKAGSATRAHLKWLNQGHRANLERRS
jgi:hypothetical protein